MSIPFWFVFISALLIFIARVPVAKAMKEQGGYDNQLPREQQARLTGLGARALAGHQNSFEAFMLFSAAVLMAHTTQTQGLLIDTLAIVFVCARIVFLLCYWADRALQRSLAWVVGMLCTLLLMLSPAFKSLLV